jgi:hypothetical protein
MELRLDLGVIEGMKWFWTSIPSGKDDWWLPQIPLPPIPISICLDTLFHNGLVVRRDRNRLYWYECRRAARPAAGDQCSTTRSHSLHHQVTANRLYSCQHCIFPCDTTSSIGGRRFDHPTTR